MPKRTLVKRERIMIVGAFALLGLILFVPRGQEFARDYERTRSQVDDAIDRLNEIRRMRKLVLTERGDRRIIMDRVEARDPNFDLYSFTNASLIQLSMHDRARLQSQGSRFSGGALDVVQLNLSNVNMQQIIDLLHKLHSSGNLIAMLLEIAQRLAYRNGTLAWCQCRPCMAGLLGGACTLGNGGKNLALSRKDRFTGEWVV